jgi:hypothetical protein
MLLLAGQKYRTRTLDRGWWDAGPNPDWKARKDRNCAIDLSLLQPLRPKIPAQPHWGRVRKAEASMFPPVPIIPSDWPACTDSQSPAQNPGFSWRRKSRLPRSSCQRRGEVRPDRRTATVGCASGVRAPGAEVVPQDERPKPTTSQEGRVSAQRFSDTPCDRNQTHLRPLRELPKADPATASTSSPSCPSSLSRAYPGPQS